MGRTKKENCRDFAGKHVKEEEKSHCHHHSPETLLLLLGGLNITNPDATATVFLHRTQVWPREIRPLD